MDDKTNQDFIQSEILKAKYAGGSILGGWMNVGNFSDPSGRIEAPKPDPQTPHEGIEWEFSRQEYRYNVSDILAIVPDPDKEVDFRFKETAEDYYYGDEVTPETIDAIIAKLEHFKRVVFGEGD